MGIRGIRDSRGTGGGMRKLGDVTGAMMGDLQSARQRTTLAQPQPPQRRPHGRANTTTSSDGSDHGSGGSGEGRHAAAVGGW